MTEKKELVANLTLDMKRNRVRIYRSTLQGLGNPSFIQFLINPEDLYIAILGSEIPLSGGTANRVAYFSMRTLKRIERRKLSGGQGK